MSPFLLILIVYGGLLAAAGLWLGRRTLSSSDFFVADRKLGPGLLFSTVLAANIGAGSTVGAAGLGYQLGLSAWWWVASAGIGSLILAFTVGPRIRKLAGEMLFLTVGDFLEHRYDRRVRGAVALILWTGSLSILAGQLIMFAWLMEVTAGSSKVVGCLMGGVVVMTYFAAGGLKGAARINFVQLCAKAVGFFLAVPLALTVVGGWDGLQERLLDRPHIGTEYFSIMGIGSVGILGYVVLLVPAFIVSPGILQKIYGARDGRSVRWGIAATAAALLGFALLPALLGMVAAAEFPGLENRELALLMVMTQMLPFWLGAVLLVAVVSAEISSADAVLFMLSTSLSRDLYQTFINPQADDQRMLAAGRAAAMLSGAAAIGLAIVLPSIIDALTIFYSLLSVSLAVPLIVGLYSSFSATRACLAAILISVPATLGIHFWSAGKGIGVFSPAALGILVSLTILVLASGFNRRDR